MEPQNSRLTQSFVIKDGGKENRDLERRNKREKIGGRRKFKKRKRDEEEATKIPFPTGVLSFRSSACLWLGQETRNSFDRGQGSGGKRKREKEAFAVGRERQKRFQLAGRH